LLPRRRFLVLLCRILLGGLFNGPLRLLSSFSGNVLCLLGSLLSGLLCPLCRLPYLLGRLTQGALHLVGGFLRRLSEALRRLTDLAYRLARGVLQPFRNLTCLIPHLAGHFPDLIARPFGHLSDLLGRSSSHFPDLAGGFASNLPDLADRSSSNLPNLAGRFPDLLGRLRYPGRPPVRPDLSCPSCPSALLLLPQAYVRLCLSYFDSETLRIRYSE
jgi:hypothetical protein